MTNYNERLDELMPCDCKFLKGFAWRKGDPCEGCINGRLKQAITSLIKELVLEARIDEMDVALAEVTHWSIDDSDSAIQGYGKHRIAELKQELENYEQNLLKELEEV